MVMQKHLDEFKEQGYTVFEGLFDRETIAQWKAVFYDLIERQPKAMLPAVTHPVILAMPV